MDIFMKIVPVLGVAAILFAAYLAKKVSKQSAGTDRMKEIAASINGANDITLNENTNNGEIITPDSNINNENGVIVITENTNTETTQK